MKVEKAKAIRTKIEHFYSIYSRTNLITWGLFADMPNSTGCSYGTSHERVVSEFVPILQYLEIDMPINKIT